ncbi:hypothetical protein [Microterricola pindariensis]|uniref:Ribosomally synthesized peptide with SipW-like signal peptide n=1 Tax=Microterricola pindariensis TaxID=478010 RepID=A0ABX5AYE6_9MICO|nr:hypothetical protein [Microterricola pindariensis]PPL19384.1 hypothetical protein GY24_06080 [Microterricola pindariensis]
MTASTSSKRTKRSTAIRLSLAGLALVGIGAAATTAAWTDNVFFSASATSATFDLQGSVNGTDFLDGATEAGAISFAVAPAAFENIKPGETRTTSIWIKNNSSIDAKLAAPVVTGTGALFTDAAQPLTASVAKTAGGAIAAGDTLASGATLQLTVTVVAPNWTDAKFKGSTGNTLKIQFAGASS